MHRRQAFNRSLSAAVGLSFGLTLAFVATSVGALSQTWSVDADFTAGTLVDAVADADQLRLDVAGVGEPDGAIGWWDAAWGQRRCIDVTNNEPGVLTEFQIVLAVDTATPIAGARMDAAGDDIRFIAADESTELDHWIEGPIDDDATTIWVQTDTLPAGSSTICMYYDNPAAPPQSDPFAPFTYTTPQPLYVAVSETQVNRSIAVTSYVADNEISDGITTTTIGVGGTHTFPGAGHTAATIVSATGPLALQGVGSGSDSYVPLAFAGTDFVIASSRNANRLSFFAPFADAAVTIEHSGTTTNVTVPVGTSVSVNADVTANEDSAVVTSDQAVLVTHVAQDADAFVAVPASDAPLYGVRSTQHFTGFGEDDTAVSIDESDGTHLFIAGTAGSANRRTGGGQDGTGPAVLVTPAVGGMISSTQQADTDGGESTSFWPRSEMNVVYRTPVDAEYVAFACPEQALANLESDGATLDCTGIGGAPFPGKALDVGGLVAGDLFQSLDGVPFFMYMEDESDDENNVLGPKQARLATANPPTSVIGPEQSPYVSPGLWTSTAEDAGCGALFGALVWNPTTQPMSTDVQFQFASSSSSTGPFTFLGPDGTTASFYTVASGTPIAAVHDGDQFFRVEATLTSADVALTPTVDDVTVEFDGAVTVAGRLFGDMAGDGVDTGDPGLGGIDVTLWLDDGDNIFDDATDTNIGTMPSAGDGSFQFDGLAPGTYFALADEAQLPPGYMTPGTTPNPSDPLVATDCNTVTTEIGWQLKSSILVTVFSDVGGDGGFAPPDVVLPAVDVELWIDDGDGIFDPGTDTRSATLPSDTAGVATFLDLPIGDYFALVPTAPASHAPTATTANPAGPLSIVDDRSVAATIGFEPLGALTGTAFSDLDGDGILTGTEPGIPDLVITVYLDDGDGVFQPGLDPVVASVVTDADGAYEVLDLIAGNHWVVPGPPTAPDLSLPPEIVGVLAGQSVTHDLPFPQEPVVPVGSITGTAFSDLDGDGILTGTEPGIPDLVITVYLDDGDGVFQPGLDPVVASVVTDADGRFTVEDLTEGSYWTVARDAPMPNIDLPAILVVLPAGETVVQDLPFAQSALIAGVVVVDADGTAGPASLPMPGLTVTLFLDDGDGVLDPTTDAEVATTTSNSAGEFRFDDLPPGDYLVQLTGTSPVLVAGATVIGDNPLGPLSAGSVGLVFAFHPDSLQLPETGATAMRAGLTIGSLLILAGLALLFSGRRRHNALLI